MLQTSAPRRPFLLACAALAASIAAGVATTAQSSTDTWWTGYGSGADHSRYVPSTQITRDNVSRLQVAWTYPYGDTGSGPIVVRGVVYGRGRNGSLIALDAKTGKERWVRERMNGMTSRGMNYWDSADGRDQRLIFAMNGLLQEVDAKTGKSIMSFGTNGAVDLRVGLDGRDPATHRQHPVEHSRRDLRATSSSSAARPAKATCRRRATSARMTWSPASWCGPSTPCRGPASSATTRGRRRRGSTSAA